MYPVPGGRIIVTLGAENKCCIPCCTCPHHDIFAAHATNLWCFFARSMAPPCGKRVLVLQQCVSSGDSVQNVQRFHRWHVQYGRSCRPQHPRVTRSRLLLFYLSHQAGLTPCIALLPALLRIHSLDPPPRIIAYCIPPSRK